MQKKPPSSRPSRHCPSDEFHELKCWIRSQFDELPTKCDLKQLAETIMEAIESFSRRVHAALDGLAGDIDFLKAKILELQNSPGAFTPADQVLVDAIQARVESMDAATEKPLVPNP